MTVRQFEKKDYEEVVLLLQDVSIFMPKADQKYLILESFVSQPNFSAFVAEIKGRIVGFGSIFLYSRVRGGCSAVIEDIVVARDVRRRGVGKKILNELILFASLKGCFKVSLEASNSAQFFYESLGFTSGGRSMRLIIKT